MSDRDTPTRARHDLDRWREAATRPELQRDRFFERLLIRHLGEDSKAAFEALGRIAKRAGPQLDELVGESSRDENLPRLGTGDRFGRPAEEIVFHPSYHEVGRVFWSSRALSVLERPGNELLAGAIAYVLDQHGEAGHACPVACTAGAIKLIQQLGTDDQKTRYLPALLDPDYDRRLHAAQFVTEIQGGSDVGSNACVATPDEKYAGSYRISGEKWFCSVADAGLFVVSARLPDAPPGTRGLGLFLVPRMIDGTPNGFRLRRLKEKLGTRSMATAEIEFEGALAEPIGPIEEGFRNLVSIVLDTSRVHNALAACGIMRRSFLESDTYARSRRAFARPIAGFGAVRSTLARMKLRTMAGLATTFRILAMTDRLTCGEDARLVATRRIAVMINKYWTATAATANSRAGIEILGGNGTVEDFSVLPRLYRDAIVIESWEGTHNTLCAQVVRDFAARRLHEPWLESLDLEIAGHERTDSHGHADVARALFADVEGRIARLLASDEDRSNRLMRPVVDRMCRLTDWVSLATQHQWELERGLDTDTGVALDLYRLLLIDRVDPQDNPRVMDLEASLTAAPE